MQPQRLQSQTSKRFFSNIRNVRWKIYTRQAAVLEYIATYTRNRIRDGDACQ